MYNRVIVAFIFSLMAFGLTASFARADTETPVTLRDYSKPQTLQSASTNPIQALAEPAGAPAVNPWGYALILIGVGIALASLAITAALLLRHKRSRQFSISET